MHIILRHIDSRAVYAQRLVADDYPSFARNAMARQLVEDLGLDKRDIEVLELDSDYRIIDKYELIY